jgi:hypothetical protein
VDATWGDVDGDGQVGISDIFSSITASPDGKVIHFSGGLIPPGGRFTDIHLAVSDSPPFLAGVDSSVEGVLAPEPHTFVLGACSLIALLVRKHLLMSRTLRAGRPSGDTQ